MKINIIFSDSSGGVKAVSMSLFSAFSKLKIKSNLVNLSNFGGGFVRRFYKIIRHLMCFSKGDALILQHFFPIFIGLLLRPMGYKKIVNVVHTDLVTYYYSVPFFKKIIVKIIFYFLRSEVVVFVSREAEVRAKFKFNLRNTITIYNVYNFSNLQFNRPTANKKVRLGSISRLHKVKNIDLLIRVLKDVVRKKPNIELLIYGVGDQETKLKEYIKAHECENFIKLLGISNDKNKMYSSIDALVSLSSIEGFGMTILESINYGVPVLYTDCSSGPRELMSPSSEPLTKTQSFEKTNVGYLVKPTSETATYSDNLDCEELEYVYIMQSFIDDVKNNQFSMKYDTERFSDEVIAQEWIALISRFP